MRTVGFLALMAFAVFVSFRILTPPTQVIQVLAAPDGSRQVRLMHVYYSSEPGYKIAVRSGRLWHTLFYLAAFNDGRTADERTAELRWSLDSRQLFFDINGRPVWGYDFGKSRRLP
jgi:hypothetical protein